MATWLRIICLICALVSAFSSVFTAIIHWIIPRMRRNPGQLIFIQSHIQIIIDLNLVFFIAFSDVYFKIPCTVLGIIFSSSMALSLVFNTCLSIEILWNIRQKIVTGHSKRSKFYYACAAFIPLALGLLGWFTDSYGKNFIGICFFTDSSPADTTYFVFVIVCMAIKMFTMVVSWKHCTFDKSNVIFQCFVIVVICNIVDCISLTFGALRSEGINVQYSPDFIILFYTPLGFAIAFLRIYNKELMRELYWKMFPKYIPRSVTSSSINSEEELISSTILLNNEPMNIADYFSISSIRNLGKILVSITLRFSDFEQEYEVYALYNIYYFSTTRVYNLLLINSLVECSNLLSDQISLKEHMPRIFESIRNLSGIENYELFHNFFNKSNIKKLKRLQNLEGGKSNEFLFETSDRKFILKIINSSEKNCMLDMCENYCRRLYDCPQSKLVRIFGLYTLSQEKINFIIMENVLPNRENMVVFDIKGSKLNRKVEVINKKIQGKVLKDLNFKEMRLKIITARDILEILRKDFELLKGFGVMDYSLLIGIPYDELKEGNNVILSNNVKIAVIDLLQRYNFEKKYEKGVKSIVFKKEDVSAVSPSLYFDRLSQDLSMIFVSK